MTLTSDELFELTEGGEIEIKAALGRDGRGELPRSFWESYSAMANSDGGVILLGIEETSKGAFQVVGLKDTAKVQKTLWDGLNDRGQVSANVLSAKSVEILSIDEKLVVKISVPRAKRNQRPVYVGRNPLTGTFQRRYEGDYHCEAEAVRRMLAEQVEEERDSKILPGFDVDDLEEETLRAYRGAVRAAKPNLPWHDMDDKGFLSSLGAWRRDRETGVAGLTLGGLLTLGKLPAILDAAPHYMLDYQERPAPKTELRWVDRLTTDGEWSGNLFDFCRMVLRKLFTGLPVPFQLLGATRVDQTPVHEALREALVNTLIHADFTGRVSILVVKRSDLYGFRNPGCMRVSLDDALAGGMSDCRNRVLQRLFRMAGYAEQAGQGIPKIYSGWATQLWRAPILQEKREDPEQTLLTMPMISLLSNETVSNLEVRFGTRYRNLPTTQQMALATVAAEGRVSHARLKTMVYDHPKDITAALSSLCRDRFLESAGLGRAKYYFFPGEPPAALEEEGPLLFDSALGSSEQMAGRFEQSAGRSEQSATRSEHLARDSEQWTLLMELSRSVRSTKKAPRQEVESAILRLCEVRHLTLRELEELIGRTANSLRVHYLSGMAKRGLVRLQFPEAVNHPNQAYASVRPLS